MPTNFEQLAVPDNAATVTPHDSNSLANKGILYVGTGGDVAVTTAGGDNVTFVGVPNGSFLPVQIAVVKTTGTTASDILALY